MLSTHHSCQILIKLELLDRFSKNTQVSNFMKILPVEDELFPADGRTDMSKRIVAFRNFTNAPKNLTAETVLSFFFPHSADHSNINEYVRWAAVIPEKTIGQNVTSCVVGRYQRFGGWYCLRIHSSVSWRWNQYPTPKRLPYRPIRRYIAEDNIYYLCFEKFVSHQTVLMLEWALTFSSPPITVAVTYMPCAVT